jgi:hypothetical protein
VGQGKGREEMRDTRRGGITFIKSIFYLIPLHPSSPSPIEKKKKREKGRGRETYLQQA